MFPSRDRIFLILFLIFVVVFELYHVAIDTNPPSSIRVVYIVIYLGFSILSPRLISTFTSINLIIERFSCSFGEYLPNTLIFHIIVLLFGIISLRGKNSHSLQRSYDPINLIWLAVFMAYALIVTLFNADHHFDLSLIVNGIFLMLFLGFINQSKNIYVRTNVISMIISIVVVCIIGLYNYDNLVSDYSTSMGSVDRLQWKDANYFSFYIGLMILITINVLSQASRKSYRKLLMCSLLLMFVTMTVLLSRGAFVALFLSLLYYYRRKFFVLGNFKYCFSIIVLLVVLYSIGLFDGIIARFLSDDFQTGSGRTEIWSVGLKTFFSQNAFSIIWGTGGGRDFIMTYFDGKYWSPHNNYLAIMYCYGIVGLLIFCSWLIHMYKSIHSKGVRSIVVFIIVNSFFIVPFTYVPTLWMTIPIIMIWDRKINGYINL